MKHRHSLLKPPVFILLFAVSLLMIQSCTTFSSKKDTDPVIQSMIDSMSLEQKVQLVIGTGMRIDLPDSIRRKFPFLMDDGNIVDSGYIDMIRRVRAYLPGAAGFTAEYPELGITSQALADGPAGLRISPNRKNEERTYYCTAFPIATLLASSWDTSLVYHVGKAMGNEVLEYGADVLLGPAMNLQRDPLCGRNFEYYSEDPLITGRMAASMVKGVQSNGAGTSIKHFAANNQETNRLSVNTIVSERALREIYLKGFEIAVKEAQPWTVMSSYNKINGRYTSESNDLLTKILRNDWGFEGYVMTDWGGGKDVVAQMRAGNDLIMPGNGIKIQELIDSVKAGKLDESVLDRNLSRILGIMLKTPRYRGTGSINNPDLTAHAAVTRKAATEGIVLLENRNNALPFSPGIKKIGAFGNTSYEFLSGGTGSGDVNEAYTVSLTEGLANAGYEVDQDLASSYKKYIEDVRSKLPKPRNWWEAMMNAKKPVDEMNLKEEMAVKLAKSTDIALITIGRNAGEGADRKAVPGDFYLTDTEISLIKTVSDAFHTEGKQSVVILNIAGVIETASWREFPDAILLAWQPGQEAGNSVTDVLSGKVNPSGKLAVSFPLNYNDVPSAAHFPGNAEENAEKPDTTVPVFMRSIPWEVVYKEDIYVGYRYYNTFNIPVAYEFGYGKSYTNFEYNLFSLNSDKFKKGLTASVEIKNTGTVAGREVVEVYLSCPEGRLEKPALKLIAFGKTKLLEPGEVQSMQFGITAMDLASFDETSSCWIAEKGKYVVRIGSSSLQIKQEAGFSLNKEINAGSVSRALTPQKEVEWMKRK